MSTNQPRDSNLIHFAPPRSTFNPSFWEAFYQNKLNVYKLSKEAVEISAEYDVSSSSKSGGFHFTSDSFERKPLSSANRPIVRGDLIIADSLEQFTTFDKRKLLEEKCFDLLKAISDGRAIESPELLQRFSLLAFPDLKTYKFYYWFCQPIITFSSQSSSVYQVFSPIRDLFLSRDASCSISIAALQEVVRASYGHLLGSFHLNSEKESERKGVSYIFIARLMADLVVIQSLSEGWDGRFKEDAVIVFLDQSSSSSSLGWSLRNIIAMLSLSSFPTAADQSFKSLDEVVGSRDRKVRIVALRNQILEKKSGSEFEQKLTVEQLNEADDSIYLESSISILTASERNSSSDLKYYGWELNERYERMLWKGEVGCYCFNRGRPGPQVADLSALMNHDLLMNQAVDLNLRLMKWRMWPTLQVEKLANEKCLLLGAGTLGCSVARCLIGWGVRHITFVDNGIVSFSNPVRQSLFLYEDCLRKKFKSITAAERLKQIFPDLRTEGVILTIPMPGHPFQHSPPAAADGKSQESHNELYVDGFAVERLDELIRDHDFIFTLTDSREARWLPMVISRVYDKPVINAALGFDSYLVMRQTASVGCYFCNDITAAGNSRQGRPLDEQCTVTRPGLSLIAGGLCGELLVAMVHDEQHGTSNGEYRNVPHQIRGFLPDFSQTVIEGARFPFCTACSSSVIEQYKLRRSDFVNAVAADPSLLEEISGIRQMTANVDLDKCIDSDDDF